MVICCTSLGFREKHNPAAKQKDTIIPDNPSPPNMKKAGFDVDRDNPLMVPGNFLCSSTAENYSSVNSGFESLGSLGEILRHWP